MTHIFQRGDYVMCWWIVGDETKLLTSVTASPPPPQSLPLLPTSGAPLWSSYSSSSSCFHVPVSPPSLYLLFLLLMCTCFFTFCLSSSCCFFSTLCICFFTFRFSSSCSYFSLLLRSPPLPFPPSSHSFCLVSRPFPPFREGMKSKISSCCIHDQVMIMYYHQPSCAARWWQWSPKKRWLFDQWFDPSFAWLVPIHPSIITWYLVLPSITRHPPRVISSNGMTRLGIALFHLSFICTWLNLKALSFPCITFILILIVINSTS